MEVEWAKAAQNRQSVVTHEDIEFDVRKVSPDEEKKSTELLQQWGNACFDEENELIELFRRCPRCSHSLRPLILDTFTDANDGKQYERMWWTCPGIGKDCFFPLDIPKEVFWTRRTMEQSLRGIHPLPNLHLLPRSLHALYPKLFKSNIDVEKMVQLASFVPSDGAETDVTPAERRTAADAPSQPDVSEPFVSAGGGECGGGGDSTSLSISLPALPQTSQCPAYDGVQASNCGDVNETVQSYLKDNLQNRLFCPKATSDERDHRKSIDLHPNANAALNSHLLLEVNGNPNRVLSSLNSVPAGHYRQRRQPISPRYMSQQQHVRLKGMLRSVKSKLHQMGEKEYMNDGTSAEKSRVSRYLFSRREWQKQKAKGGTKERATAAEDGGEARKTKKGRGLRKDGGELDVFAALDSLQKSLVSKELMDRFYGVQRPSTVTPSRETTQPTKLFGPPTAQTPPNVLPPSPANGQWPTTPNFTSLVNSSVSDSSSQGRLKRGLSIGPALPGASDSTEDPSLSEKITRNYESIFLRALEQFSSSRRSVTPSSLSSQHIRLGSPQGEAVRPEGGEPRDGTLSGIPHDFHSSSRPEPSHLPPLPPIARPTNQLTPINYAQGENVDTRFAQDRLEVTELGQQQQPSSLALDMMDYDAYLGYGLEEAGDDQTEFGMAPMMPPGEADDESAFLRAHMSMLP
uniref:Uncharacterized protein n=1 Tax=Globodera rostochiensis TaxID=31243 RepID=A0A914HEC8_GLORO